MTIRTSPAGAGADRMLTAHAAGRRSRHRPVMPAQSAGLVSSPGRSGAARPGFPPPALAR
jgi:hypothetical protein